MLSYFVNPFFRAVIIISFRYKYKVVARRDGRNS